MKYLIILFFCFAGISAKSQADTSVLLVAEQMPRFPGGQDSLNAFIASNIKYPAAAIKNNIEGTVQVQFVVEADGHITNVKCVKEIGHGCDYEAIRIVRLMRWIPGYHAGQPQRVMMVIPIKFSYLK